MPRLVRALWPFLAGALVVLAMLGVADRARGAADRARQAQVVLERMNAGSARVESLTWRSLAMHTAVASPAAVAKGLVLYGQIYDSVDRARRLGVDPERVDAFETSLSRAYGAAMASADPEHPERARALVRGPFSTALQELDRDAADAIKAQDEVAHAAGVWSRGATGGAILGGLFILGMIVRRVRRRDLAERGRQVAEQGERRLHALLSQSTDVVAVIDASSRVRWIATSVQRMLGYDAGELAGARLTGFVHPDETHRAIAALRELAEDGTKPGSLSLRVRAADGTYRHLEVNAENHLGDPEIGGVLMNLRDVSERHALERELRHQAFHDGLTGLANRELFEDRLTQALARMRRHGDRPAVIFIDLDDFKTVNDSLGHAVGDELLRTASERLQSALRAQDTAARFGGDEFAVLLEDLGDEDAADVAERIRQALAEPVTLGERRIAPAASMGIAYPGPATTADELLGNADVAMYAAKERGKGQMAAFEPTMRERVVERLDLIGDLTLALERDELFVEYQPIITLDTGGISGVEALVRWQHPERGRLAPDRFIDLAEQTGLIVPLGRWVLGAACATLARWDADGAPPLDLSVNVSTRQLADPAFPGEVAAVLARHAIAPGRLTLEITEHVLVHDSEAMQHQLAAVKAIGVRLAVDDFGTGYSALSYLQAFPIDVLKVDRSFVAGIDRDEEKARLVQGIVEMGHNLQLKVVAEGIEEAGEASLLRDFRSSYGQGYLFSRPVAAGAIPALLEDERAAAATAAA